MKLTVSSVLFFVLRVLVFFACGIVVSVHSISIEVKTIATEFLIYLYLVYAISHPHTLNYKGGYAIAKYFLFGLILLPFSMVFFFNTNEYIVLSTLLSTSLVIILIWYKLALSSFPVAKSYKTPIHLLISGVTFLFYCCFVHVINIIFSSFPFSNQLSYELDIFCQTCLAIGIIFTIVAFLIFIFYVDFRYFNFRPINVEIPIGLENPFRQIYLGSRVILKASLLFCEQWTKAIVINYILFLRKSKLLISILWHAWPIFIIICYGTAIPVLIKLITPYYISYFNGDFNWSVAGLFLIGILAFCLRATVMCFFTDKSSINDSFMPHLFKEAVNAATVESIICVIICFWAGVGLLLFHLIKHPMSGQTIPWFTGISLVLFIVIILRHHYRKNQTREVFDTVIRPFVFFKWAKINDKHSFIRTSIIFSISILLMIGGQVTHYDRNINERNVADSNIVINSLKKKNDSLNEVKNNRFQEDSLNRMLNTIKLLRDSLDRIKSGSIKSLDSTDELREVKISTIKKQAGSENEVRPRPIGHPYHSYVSGQGRFIFYTYEGNRGIIVDGDYYHLPRYDLDYLPDQQISGKTLSIDLPAGWHNINIPELNEIKWYELKEKSCQIIRIGDKIR